MLILNQLKEGDRKLQLIAVGIFLGLLLLVGGLWWVQIISSKRYAENLRVQSFRSVRIPALRGKIVDRNGLVLAENRPRYDVNVYLEEIRGQFLFQYTNQVVPQFTNEHPNVKRSGKIRDDLWMEARYRAVSNLTWRVSSFFGAPRILDRKRFLRHYNEKPFMPLTLLPDLSPQQVAVYAERLTDLPGVELEVQSLRVYPNKSAAAHMLGFVRWKDSFAEESDADLSFKFALPDFEPVKGIEASFDEYLRGKPGVKSLLVNSMRYRIREEIAQPTEPGQNVWLTIDLPLQQAVEKALAAAPVWKVRGAAIVVDVTNGDILALASEPSFDPNQYLTGITPDEAKRLADPFLRPEVNRATRDENTPGSIFKIVTSIACLETGLNPHEKMYNPGEWRATPRSKPIDDTAAPGDYDFKRAFKRSSNTYFIEHGLKAGINKIAEVAHRFHLGETTGIASRQEAPGVMPNPDTVVQWPPSRVPNVCIGQEVTTTPIQMVMLTAAVANGGTLYWPRLVSRTEANGFDETTTTNIPAGRIRDHMRLAPQHLSVLHEAMLADVEFMDGEEGSGRPAYIPGFKIAGKTGTAEIKVHGQADKTTWFTSYGPYENPRYAVIVMVESGASGGKTCAPVAKAIYEAIIRREKEQAGLKLSGEGAPANRRVN